VSESLQLVPRPGTDWRIAQYSEYIVELRQRLTKERNSEERRRDEALLRGWIDLRAEVEAELAELAREKREAIPA
jgi:hypothetical protein